MPVRSKSGGLAREPGVVVITADRQPGRQSASLGRSG
jgi:hypothetical protein